MKKLKITICSLLVLCSCFVLAACGNVDKDFKVENLKIGNTEFVYDGQSHVFEIEYEDVDLEIEYSTDKETFKKASELNFVGNDSTPQTYEVYYKVSAEGYDDYISEEKVEIKIVPKAVELTNASSVSYYDSLREAVLNADNTASFKFYADASGAGVKVESGKTFEVDFNGYSYCVDQMPMVGSPNTVSQCFQLLKDSNIIFKNGSITRGNINCGILVQNYANLTLDNMTLDANFNSTGSEVVKRPCYYALSNNYGNVVIKGNTNLLADKDEANENQIQQAFDLWYNLNGAYANGITVTFDTTFTGKVEGGIEYGAHTATDAWEEKTILTINGGDFSGATFKVSSADVTIPTATIILPQGWSLVELSTSGEYVISK